MEAIKDFFGSLMLRELFQDHFKLADRFEAAANQITPHTIYFLKGKEAQPID